MDEQANNTINQNVYCKYCGMQNNANSNFCSNCGNSLKELSNNNIGNMPNNISNNTVNNLANYIPNNDSSDIASNIANYIFNNKESNTSNNIANNNIPDNVSNNASNISNDVVNPQNNGQNNLQNNMQDFQSEEVEEKVDTTSDKIGFLGAMGIILMLPYFFTSIVGIVFFVVTLLVYNIYPGSRKFINIALKCLGVLVIGGIVLVLIMFGACIFSFS